MRARARAACLVLGIRALCACDGTGDTVTCPESLAAYCANAPCVLHVDRSDVVDSFCSSVTTLPVEFGTAGCDDGGSILIESTQGTFEYGTDGTLVAVTQRQLGGDPMFSCIAGPPTLVLPTSCLSNLVGYSCIRSDAGAD